MSEQKRMTIILTGRRPVTIDPNEWPYVALAENRDHDSEVPCQANRTWRCGLIVRQHADGRMIVYGGIHYDSNFAHDRDYDWNGGELLSLEGATDVPSAIRRVHLSARLDCEDDETREKLSRMWAPMARECIADLPAEDL